MSGTADDAIAVPRKSLRVNVTRAGFGVAREESFRRKDPLLPWVALIRVLIDLLPDGHPSSIDVERQPAMNAGELE